MYDKNNNCADIPLAYLEDSFRNRLAKLAPNRHSRSTKPFSNLLKKILVSNWTSQPVSLPPKIEPILSNKMGGVIICSLPSSNAKELTQGVDLLRIRHIARVLYTTVRQTQILVNTIETRSPPPV